MAFAGWWKWGLLVGALVVAAGVAVVGPRLWQAPLDTRGAEVMRETMHSDMLDRDLEQVWVLPEGFRSDERRPLLVLLHGRGDSPAGRANNALMKALADAGDDAPVVLLANGGDHSYYHDREDGPWGSYLSDELIPHTVERFGLDEDRVAYAGISMGGFGALEMTRQSEDPPCAVAAIAPAMWREAGQTPDGAFDDAADFAEHDVLGAVAADPNALHDTPVWLIVGRDDPFRETTRTLEHLLGRRGNGTAVSVEPGGHDAAFWDAHMDEVVSWTSKALADC